MPEIKSRLALKVARGATAFLNLDLGLVRGEAPSPERQIQDARAALKKRDAQIKQLQARLQGGPEKGNRQTQQAQARPGAADQKPAQADKKPNEVPGKKPNWHRAVVGGRWEEMGRLQFAFLREHGLEPDHRFLDVGCGALRGGLHFVSYLEPGRYYGIDREQRLLDAGKTELAQADLQDRRPTLARIDDFGFERLGQTFDFALAQSVFSHLPVNMITRCLVNMNRVLGPGGVFYATFFENWNGRGYLGPLVQGDGIVSHYDRDPFHYTPDMFEWACKGTSLVPEYVGDWGHPRHQLMMSFRKTA